MTDICAEQGFEHPKQSCINSPFFAIIADEATDKATKTQLSVCVSFTEKQLDVVTVQEIFLGFLHTKSTKGEAIANLLINFLNQNNLVMNKIRTQGYDGASNMSGRNNGVQALIRSHTPDAVYVHCKIHCLNLAIVHSFKEQAVRTMMATVQEIAFAFDYSAKRLEAFSTELGGNAEARQFSSITFAACKVYKKQTDRCNVS